jgi:predicted SnoaL-like aldol condensation-catalyzing enzyme
LLYPYRNFVARPSLPVDLSYSIIFYLKLKAMKKAAFIFSAVVACCLLSCAGDKGMNGKAQKNIDNSQAIAKMFESGDFSKIGDYIAEDAVDHATPRGDVKGLDSLKALFNQYAGMMSDTKNEVVKAVADDDYSMLWLKQSWTSKVDDPMMGMKAGERGNMESIEVSKHNADGKIVEHWSFMSMSEMMKMMQKSMPADTMHKMKADTSK